MAQTAREKRNQYLAETDANLEKYNARLLTMRGKVAEVRADMKMEYLSQVENLEKKRDEFKVKREELKKAGEHAWDDIKTGTENAWNEFADSMEKAASRFK